MKKLTGVSLFIFFCIVSAILTAGLVFYQNKNNIPNKDYTSGSTNVLYGVSVLDSKEVSKHNTKADCWIIVNSKVYNISNYASSHPGGTRNITNSCGKEATTAFNTKGGEGESHLSSTNEMLKDFYLGDLNQKINQDLQKSNTTTNSSTSNLGITALDALELSKHNTNANCWIIVNNKVYDISNYASSHPGGTGNILNYCGKEATSAFSTKGTKGQSHSASANNMLAQYYIGDFNQQINQTIQQNIQKVQAKPIPTNTRYDDDDDD